MSVDPAELADVRETYAARAGQGQLVEQALSERATARAYGQDTSRADKILAGLGYEPRDVAAKRRKEAAATQAAGDAAAAEAVRRQPPAGRAGKDTGKQAG